MCAQHRKYRVGVIGFAHMHVDRQINSFAELNNVEWVACADTIPLRTSISKEPMTRKANIKRAKEYIGIPKIYEDYREMLDKEELDIIIFCPENARHGEIATAIADKGIHMITEKPMAATLSEALEMTRVAKANNVTLMINWPTTWRPAIRKMKELVDEGTVGDVWEFKFRNDDSLGPLAYGQNISDSEKGAEWWHQSLPGGGALLDYCCYGACLSRWFIGEPALAAYGIKANLTSHYGNAEDNAIITIRYPKALAILEGTWTTFHTGIPTGPIVYGTKGTLVATYEKVESKLIPVVQIFTERGNPKPTQVVKGEPLPEGRETLAQEIIHHLQTGEPLHPTLDMMFNLEVMAILDAGIRSSNSGRLELINDINWCIG